MSLHVALLEAIPAPAAGDVARRCAAVDAPLHLIGPLSFSLDDPVFRKKGPTEWDTLDWWLHPTWRDFRNAMSRERCLYFARDGRDIETAPFCPNSVLVFGDEALGLPERIRDKYPERIFRVPPLGKSVKHPLPQAVSAVLATGNQRMQDGIAAMIPRASSGRRVRRHS